MSVTGTLAALGRLLRRMPPPPDDVLEAYAHEVVPVLDRAEWLYQYWLEQSTLFSDSEKLGNVAAIHRWETASMGRSLERVIPPAVLAGAHEDILDALDVASRAAQLLSSGSRFHNANAVCEGQALLAQSRDRRLAALQSMRRYLAAVIDASADVGPADPRAALSAEAAARPAGLAAAAAFVSADADDVQAASEQATTAPRSEAAAPVEQLTDGRSDDAPLDVERAQDADAALQARAEDDEEDALPWLTRLAEQEQAAEPASAEAAASPVPPPAPAPSGQEPSPGGGWGSLFRRPAPPSASPDGETPPGQA